MDYEETDRHMQARIDQWFCEVKDSLDNREITDLAYEARDLEDVAGALIELADELWDMNHRSEALATLRAGRAVEQAADKIGAIDG